MKTDFKFANLLGTVYGKGNLVFTSDGTSLLSPVGNRVSVFNLINNSSYTFPFAHRKNVACIDLNPQGNLLLSIDEDGRAILTLFHRRISIYYFSLKSPVSALSFSPSGEHFVVGLGRKIQAWRTPQTPDSSNNGEIEFAPFVLHREYGGHFDTVTGLHWSSDSRFFVSASKDLTSRIWSLDPEDGFEPTTLAGHRESVKFACFSADQESIYTVSQDGALFRWEYTSMPQVNGNDQDDMIISEDERWRIVQRNYFMQSNAKVNCAFFHAASNLLTVGFSNGLFGLYELPDFTNIHLLSISQSDISCIASNKTGEWLAFGSSKNGQLLVWEWQSESYILKQQSHLDSMNTMAYSPDGGRITTGADDGKIKIWDTSSGFHVATFTEHSSGVTGSAFSKRNNVLFTSSLDGSVRAWDMLRYRNFRTFTAPTRLSFSCLTIDPSGEVVCAGSQDSFEIHIWNVQTGQLLDQLSGHEGPISTLAFSPDGNTLISGSWDHTIRLWSVFSRTQSSEPLQLQSDLLSLAVSPDSKTLASATLDGQLTLHNISLATQTALLDARRDISGGRKTTDRRTAANVSGTKHFTTLAYSADGSCLLAAGNSKYICLYSTASLTLVKKFTVSVNLSLQGTADFLNSANILSNGMPRDLIDTDGEASDLEDRIDRTLPGVKRGDPTTRTTRPEVRVTGLEFSPTGRAFCAASTEGLLVYSLDTDHLPAFDPFDLDIDITPQSIQDTVEKDRDFLKALVMAFRLNSQPLIKYVYESIPYTDIELIVREVPLVYLVRLLGFLGRNLEESPHLEFNMRWLVAVVGTHGRWIKEHRGECAAELRAVLKGVEGVGRTVRRVAEGNLWEIEFLLGSGGGGEIGEEKMRVNGRGMERVNGDVDGEDGEEGGEWDGID
ncbi:MAG: hypothetical protein Q9227_009336 [Pyrenula ochraceoflavens]